MNVLSNERRAQVIGALIEGKSIRSTVRMAGVCKDAVLKLIRDMGAACAQFHYAAVRGVRVQRVQCDEVWGFCYAKAKNAIPPPQSGFALVDTGAFATATHNFIKIHRTLRMSPAMAAGVTDRLWSVEDLVALWEVYEQRRAERAA